MRVFVYDDTQGWLSTTFLFGSALRSLRPGKDVILKIRSWDEMIEMLKLAREKHGPAERVEYWGHGASGGVQCNDKWLWGPTMRGSNTVPRVCAVLDEVRHILRDENALWWWRTCNTFWGEAGRAFAEMCVDSLGCKTAGFTRVIGPWQSELRIAEPGAKPSWDDAGGGWSWPWHRDAVFCLSAGPF
jgi:hypothetical protein